MTRASEHTKNEVRRLWTDGLSATAIGRELNITKNAVIGLKNRMQLPARPSPIRKRGEPRAAPIKRAPKQTLAPMPPIAAPALPPRAVERAPAPKRSIALCCWPIGEPGTKSFHFCEAEAVPGKPYCGEHNGIAYTKVAA